MRREGRHRHVAALDLVIALRTRLDPLQAVRDRVVDGLVVAGLEMQEGVALQASPCRGLISSPQSACRVSPSRRTASRSLRIALRLREASAAKKSSKQR